MDFKVVENLEAEGLCIYEPPEYRKDRPLARALIVSRGEKYPVAVLDCIGPEFDHFSDMSDSISDEIGEGYMPGTWIWEGRIVSESHPSRDYGEEYDERLEGDIRRLTDEEWIEFTKNPCAGPWDDDLWFLPKEEPSEGES